MLSKIKAAALAEARSNSLPSHAPVPDPAQSDTEQESEIGSSNLDNDSNNNNNNNNNSITVNNNNNNNSKESAAKKSKDELMDIVEISRKRRLSKGSADSLGNFIRWSFSHIPDNRQQRETAAKQLMLASRMRSGDSVLDDEPDNDRLDDNENELDEDEHEDADERREQQEEEELDHKEEHTWTATLNKHLQQSQNQHHQNNSNQHHHLHQHSHNLRHHNHQNKHHPTAPEQLLRERASAAAANSRVDSPCGGSSASNLALHRQPDESPSGSPQLVPASKRARTHLRDSSEGAAVKFGATLQRQSGLAAGNKSGAGNFQLGSVVDRLHQQHQQLLSQQQSAAALQQQQQKLEAGRAQELPDQGQEQQSAGLSFHLQQFLQQQQQQQQQPSSLDYLCSSVGLDDSNQLVLAAAIHRALVDSMGGAGAAAGQLPAGAESKPAAPGNVSGASQANKQQQQQQAMNTGGNGLGASLGALSPAGLADDSIVRQRRAYNTRAAQVSHGGAGHTSGAFSPAAAASALLQSHGQSLGAGQRQASALASTLQGRSVQLHAQAAAALSALAQSAGRHQLHQSAGAAAAALANGGPLGEPGLGVGAGRPPMVDFECDTCASSFDDRHRLMQHQSIHLELKKDWFTETPVDEVMKIFNRRRGEFLCNICNLRFEATLDYDQHNHTVHGPRPYCCQFCGNGTRTFKCWRQYLNHLYDHRYIFSCTIDDCDFTVNRRDSLRFHIFRFHLNCQLPQNQLKPSALTGNGNHNHNNLAMGLNGQQHNLGSNNNYGDSKWHLLEDGDDEEDTENEMIIAD